MADSSLLLAVGLAALLGGVLGPVLARFAQAQIAALDALEAAGHNGLEIGDALRRFISPDTAVPWRWQLIYAVATAGAFGGGILLGNDGARGVYLALTFGLLVLGALLDARAFWLPDSVTQPLLWLGLLGAAAGLAPVEPADAVFGAVAAWALLATLQGIASSRLGEPALGGGDVKLVAACGALSGFSGLPLFLTLMACAAGILGLVWRGSGHGKAEWLPFGAAIAAAGICAASLAATGW